MKRQNVAKSKSLKQWKQEKHKSNTSSPLKRTKVSLYSAKLTSLPDNPENNKIRK